MLNMKRSRRGYLTLIIPAYVVAMAALVVCLSERDGCQESRGSYFYRTAGVLLSGHSLGDFRDKTRFECAHLCATTDKCRSFNYDDTSLICQLNDCRLDAFLMDVQPDGRFCYYERRQAKTSNTGWPSGTYGLPMPNGGCPVTTNFIWQTGYRFHDTENSWSSNDWSKNIHLKGQRAKYDMEQHFCMKTVDYGGPKWPAGEYCIFKYGDHCPTDMSSGSVFWQDEAGNNQNAMYGTLPSGQYDGNTRLDYCCMTGGSASSPIALPIDRPFYLFPYTTECQQVQGVTATKEWLKWDGEDDAARVEPTDEHPLYQEASGTNNMEIYYCYYQSI